MTFRIARALLLGHSALLTIFGAAARAQDAVTLPQITVNAPSPIVRRTTPPADAAPAADTQLQGSLPIVTDQFATVTVVPAE
jgi:iron complex outermembrane receptor protein